VQLRDADNHAKILVGTLQLPFEPRENRPLRVRRRPNDTRSTTYLITDVLCYEIVENDPQQSGIVYLAKQVEN
jgi:hypothetical protein